MTKNIRDLKFMHIPKCGGTSIETVGCRGGLKWGIVDREYLNSFENTQPVFPWHVPLYAFHKGNPYQNYQVFAVVRNPYDRLISEYCYKMESVQDRSVEHLNSWLTEKLQGYLTDPHINDNHFLPQHKYIYDSSGQKIIDHILHFENLKSEFDKLMQEYNSKLKLNVFVNRSGCNFTVNDLNTEVVELIKQIYELDFQLFN